MIYDRWDIVLCLFPFVDRPIAKARPATVLTTASFHRENDMLIVAMITTAAGGRRPTDYELVDLGPTGLRQPCVVRWKIMTLASAVISGRIGHIAEVDRAPLGDRLAAIMPLGVART